MSPAASLLSSLIRAHSAVSLGRYFRGLARASLAASALATAGCSTSHTGQQPPEPPPILGDAGPTTTPRGDGGSIIPDSGVVQVPDGGPTGFMAPACSADGTVALLEGLSLPEDQDYLAAYANDWGEPFLVDTLGTACAGAGNPASCLSLLDAQHENLFGHYLLSTQGDEVRRWPGGTNLTELLGPIDTPNEALLVAWHAGYDVVCGDPTLAGVRETEGGYEVIATRMTADCDPIEITSYRLFVGTDGAVQVLESEVISSEPGVCVGRRPEGLQRSEAPDTSSPVARYFAEVARLEAGAVIAFRTLAVELQALGAPAPLAREAERAADDEVRHADSMARVAGRYGVTPAEPVVASDRPLRSLYELALDNACEGCVRETFGALVGTYQSLAASDPEVREAMRVIAEEETRHAALSWKIAQWANLRLTDEARERVRDAQLESLAVLRAEMGNGPDPELGRIAGLPPARTALGMVDTLSRSLWS